MTDRISFDNYNSRDSIHNNILAGRWGWRLSSLSACLFIQLLVNLARIISNSHDTSSLKALSGIEKYTALARPEIITRIFPQLVCFTNLAQIVRRRTILSSILSNYVFVYYLFQKLKSVISFCYFHFSLLLSNM